jgi:hypothetical protein
MTCVTPSRDLWAKWIDPETLTIKERRFSVSTPTDGGVDNLDLLSLEPGQTTYAVDDWGDFMRASDRAWGPDAIERDHHWDSLWPGIYRHAENLIDELINDAAEARDWINRNTETCEPEELMRAHLDLRLLKVAIKEAHAYAALLRK